METAEEADAAITALNGTELMGRTIAVTKVRAWVLLHFALPSEPCLSPP